MKKVCLDNVVCSCGGHILGKATGTVWIVPLTYKGDYLLEYYTDDIHFDPTEVQLVCGHCNKEWTVKELKDLEQLDKNIDLLKKAYEHKEERGE